MTKDNTGELTKHLLAMAKARGFDVSEAQLKRWHRDGLLPQPRQSWISGVAGSHTIYPAGTSDQLCALCTVQAENRSAATNWGWKLWWLGFPVDEKFWRRKLKAQAALHDKSSREFVRKLDSDQPDGNDANLVDALHTKRTTNTSFRRLRRRVTKHFESMVGLMRSILAGEFIGWSSAPRDDVDSLQYRKMIERAFGFRRAKSVLQMIDNPSMHDDIESALHLLSNQLGGVKMTKVLMTSSPDFIAETRIQLRVILYTAKGLDDRATALAGLGLSVLKEMATRTTPADQAAFLLYLLALKRNSKFRKDLAVFLHALRRHTPKTISQTQIDHLRSRDPAICSFAFPN